MFVQLLPTFIDAPRIPAARGHQTVLCVGGAQRSRRLGHAKGLVESARRRSWRGTKHVDGRVIVRARIQIGAKSPQTHTGGGHGTRTLRRRGVGHIDCIHGSFYRPVVGVRRVRKWFRRHSLAILARFCPHVGRVRNVLLTVGARGKSNDENQNDRHENDSKRNTNFHCIYIPREKKFIWKKERRLLMEEEKVSRTNGRVDQCIWSTRDSRWWCPTDVSTGSTRRVYRAVLY
jgi:hypothetical protein